MITLFPVMLGGAIGAALRYFASIALLPHSGNGFPYATLAVNLAGGFAMGVLAALTLRGVVSDTVRLFIGVGVLGGFTTFSAFSLETFGMIERGDFGTAALYVILSVVGSVALIGAGLSVARL